LFGIRNIIERDGINTEDLVKDGECPIFDKYDEFIPPELLREAYAKDRLRVDEMLERFE
jgi:ATP-dependent Lhr-like helicase